VCDEYGGYAGSNGSDGAASYGWWGGRRGGRRGGGAEEWAGWVQLVHLSSARNVE